MTHLLRIAAVVCTISYASYSLAADKKDPNQKYMLVDKPIQLEFQPFLVMLGGLSAGINLGISESLAIGLSYLHLERSGDSKQWSGYSKTYGPTANFYYYHTSGILNDGMYLNAFYGVINYVNKLKDQLASPPEVYSGHSKSRRGGLLVGYLHNFSSYNYAKLGLGFQKLEVTRLKRNSERKLELHDSTIPVMEISFGLNL